MQRNGFYVVHPSGHTHFPSDPNKQPSTIDIGLTNSLFPITTSETIPMSSDHNIVVHTVQLESDVSFEPTHLCYNFKMANWTKFQRVINENLSGFDYNHSNVDSATQIDTLVNKLTTVIQHAKQVSVPLTIPNKYGLSLTPDIRDKMHQCKILQRRSQRAQNLQRKRELKQEANRLQKQINNEIDHLRNINWSHKLQDIRLDDDRIKLFDVAKFIRRRGKEIPPLKVDHSPRKS